MLKVESVDVFYGDVQVLKHISLDVQERELVAVIGANGRRENHFDEHDLRYLEASKRIYFF